MPPFHRVHEGIRVPPGVRRQPFLEAIRYQPDDDDIFIVTYQKSGTHWASTIVNLILQGKDAKVPPNYLEMYGPAAVNECHRDMGLRNVIQTHLPVALLPWNPRSRYVVVVRDPKDVLVSLYHHSRNIELYEYKDGTMEDFFREFMAGRIEYGCYYRALLDYYWLSIRSPETVLFLTYEGIHADRAGTIRKIASFIGAEVTDQRVEEIICESSIGSVRANCSKKYDAISSTSKINIRMKEAYTRDGQFIPPPAVAFARKGTVGDWRNHLTEEMARVIDQRMEAMPQGLLQLWGRKKVLGPEEIRSEE